MNATTKTLKDEYKICLQRGHTFAAPVFVRGDGAKKCSACHTMVRSRLMYIEDHVPGAGDPWQKHERPAQQTGAM